MSSSSVKGGIQPSTDVAPDGARGAKRLRAINIALLRSEGILTSIAAILNKRIKTDLTGG
jgi:hypothetical protein